MRYSGSKARFMKQLLPILMDGTNEETTFIDAFGGGMNVISEIPLKHKIAIEINKYIVALWNAIKVVGLDNLDIPKNCNELTQEMYEDIKKSYINNDDRYPDWMKGYVGACCSYGSAWFNGYAKFNISRNEDHIREAYNNLERQVDKFKNLKSTAFVHHSYMNYMYPTKNAVVYCDPPYMNTKKYESDFDHRLFWEIVRIMSKSGIKVYISEYEAPDDFKCIWQADKKDGMGTTKKGQKQNTKTEKLFIHESLLSQ